MYIVTQSDTDPPRESPLGDREERPPGVGFVALSWINFGLLVAALLKFAPLILSYAHGADLSPDQIALGLGEQRTWALDLISDTPYLLAIWILVANFLQWQTGKMRVFPWR